MKKIFITGIAGFLGSHLADRLLELGYEVVGCDNLIGGYLDNVPKKATFHKIDCCNLEEMTNIMAGCDTVFHAACTAYEGLSVFSPTLISLHTYQASVSTFTAAIRSKVSKFIFCSSMARYGAHSNKDFTEDLVCNPIDPYGIAKYSVELLLKNLSKVHGIELIIAVPHNIIGVRQKYDDPYRNVASIMINMILQDKRPVIYGDGKQVRCFSSIKDDINCLVKIVEMKGLDGLIVNIGPDENPVTILELFNLIRNKINKNIEPVFYPDRPQEVKHATCSANLARKILGYKTTCTLEQTIEEMIVWIQKRGVSKFEYHLPIEIISELTPKTWTNKIF